MIDARIRITTPTPDYLGQMEELLARGLKVSTDVGKGIVRLEVEYPSDTPGQWELTGDAIEIDYTIMPPTVVTLPPYSEVTP